MRGCGIQGEADIQHEVILIADGIANGFDITHVGDAHFVAELTTEGSDYRLPKRLTLDIPQSNVNSGHRLNGRTTATEIARLQIHLVPQPTCIARLLTQQGRTQPVDLGVRVPGLNQRLGDCWAAIDLASADQPCIGRDLHQQGGLGTVRSLLNLRQSQVDGLHVRYLHLLAPSRRAISA